MPVSRRSARARTWAGLALLLCALAGVAGSPLLGAVRYVDSILGSDSNDGSPLRPWKTVSYAMTQVVYGDEVRVGPGEYSPATGEPGSFTLRNGVALIGAGMGRTVYSGNGTGPIVTYAQGLDLDCGTRIEGFTFRDAYDFIAYGCSTGPSCIAIRGNEFRSLFNPAGVLGLGTVEGCDMTAEIEDNVFLASVPAQSFLYLTATAPAVGSPGGRVAARVRGNRFSSEDVTRAWVDDAIEISASDDSSATVLLEDNTFRHATFAVVAISERYLAGPARVNVEFLRNRVYGPRINLYADGVAAWPIGGSGIELRMENNILVGLDTALNAGTDDGSAPLVTVTSTNDTIADCDRAAIIGGAQTTLAVRNAVFRPINLTVFDVRQGAAVTVDYSNVDGGWPGPGNIDVDPRFLDLPAQDIGLGAGSPCIDSATSDAAPGDDNIYALRRDETSVADSGAGSMPWFDMGALEFRGDSAGCGIAIPLEVDDVKVSKQGLDAEIRWQVASLALSYRIATGLIRDLIPAAFYPAECLGSVASTTFLDVRAGPPLGNGFWYLIRAETPCGPGTFGNSTRTPDPRDALDAWFPYSERPCP